jgi:hypothetical protein
VYTIENMSSANQGAWMKYTARSLAACITVIGVALGMTLGSAGPAQAATAHGRSCGEDHPMDPEYYDGGGNAAPCFAYFHVDRTVVARITVDVIPMHGIERQDPHRWNVDIDLCEGTVLPADQPRSFTCTVGPGDHSVYAEKFGLDSFVALTVDY